MPARIAAAARLAAGLALAVAAGEAAAQTNNVCSNTPATGQGIFCQATTAADLSASTSNLDISTVTYGVRLINSYYGWTEGESADVSVEMTGGSITTTTNTGAHGIYAEMLAGASVGDVTVDLTNVAISVTGGSAHGIFVDHRGKGARRVRMSGGSIETAGEVSPGTSARGIFVDADRSNAEGKITVDLSGGIAIKSVSGGIYTKESTFDGTEISLSDVSIETRGDSGGTALYAQRIGQVKTEDGVVTKGDLVIDLTDATLVTAPRATFARGVHAWDTGAGDVRVTFTSGRIRTGAVNGVGVEAEQGRRGYPPLLFGLGGGSVVNHGGWSENTGAGSIAVTVGAEARIESPFSVGVSGILGNPKVGTGRIVTGHAGEIEARDAGIVAWAARWSGSTFGEGYEATTDDAARTAPMIHVTSSGDVTVGAGVMDDFIRTVVAGADGTLSTAERSVLDAIVEDEDPDALDTALAALPASYTDDYKADARALLASRTWAPDFPSGRSDAEADRILGLPAAGIRALVHSHNRIATLVGGGDVDPALSGRFFLTPEEQATLDAQREFSESEEAVMRAVLAGGEGLEALLAPLPAAYTDDWKDEVRRLAQLYNEGDVRVDVTGGTIVSEGHGVDARYAVRHDRNGAIEVTVAEGATVTGAMAGVYAANAGVGGIHISVEDGAEVTGGETGIHVANAGLGDLPMNWRTTLELEEEEDADVTGLRRHFVTVHGMVMGGTDAAVHLAGGGVLLVGPTGKVHAGSSGVGVLVNDPGVAHVHVQGEVKGAEGGAAAVHLTGGGSVRVGETGRMLANGADRAIRTDVPPGDTPMARVSLLVGTTRYEDGSRPSSEDIQSLLARMEGSFGAGPADSGSPGKVVVPYADGSGRTIENAIGPDGMLALDLGDFPCPPGQVRGADGGECRPPCPEGQNRGEDGECRAPPPPPCPAGQARGDDGECPAPPPKPVMRGFDCGEAIDTRCRLYEALPSILLSMNGLPTWEERMSAARDARGGWARVEVADGKWKADHSTRPDVAYDHRRRGLRVGTDFAVGAARGVGVSLHGLRGSAEMAQGGEVDLSGYGLGVHATMAFADGFHADAQAAMTWYEADLESARADLGALKKGVDGRGHALGVEVGRRMGLRDGVSVTPRVGLTWSTVDLDDFADGAARVSVEDARSLKGRVGVGVEKARGDDMQGSRLFGSLDVEREFEEETETRVSGTSPGSSVTSLKAKAERTAYRLAVGGARVWGEGRYSLRGSVGYTGSGGDNRDLGGGLSFSLRF